MIITRLSNHVGDFHVSGANVSRERLLDVSYNVPSWEQIVDGLCPGVPAEDPEPGVPRQWVAVPRSSGDGRLFLQAWSGPTAHRYAASDGPVRTTRSRR